MTLKYRARILLLVALLLVSDVGRLLTLEESRTLAHLPPEVFYSTEAMASAAADVVWCCGSFLAARKDTCYWLTSLSEVFSTTRQVTAPSATKWWHSNTIFRRERSASRRRPQVHDVSPAPRPGAVIFWWDHHVATSHPFATCGAEGIQRIG